MSIKTDGSTASACEQGYGTYSPDNRNGYRGKQNEAFKDALISSFHEHQGIEIEPQKADEKVSAKNKPNEVFSKRYRCDPCNTAFVMGGFLAGGGVAGGVTGGLVSAFTAASAGVAIGSGIGVFGVILASGTVYLYCRR
ncbi:MAG: hypothetical protein ACPGUD_12205 [Parashewanella sp.]